MKCGRNETRSLITHPAETDTKLSFVADVPHILKNIRSCFTSGQIFELPDYIVEAWHSKSF